MDASPEVLADHVRAKRAAVDSDLERLRVRLRRADPRQVDVRAYAVRYAKTVVPVIAGVGALWIWAKRRRSVNSLDHLLVRELADLYAAEQHLVPALQMMSERATNPELEQAFEQHRLETEAQIERLERVFRSVRARPKNGSSDSVDAVMSEGKRLLRRRVDPDVRDAWLIATAQRIEHIEIANYGTARTYAETLGYTYAAQLLQQSLEEERATDEKLTLLAERFVNPQSIRDSRSA